MKKTTNLSASYDVELAQKVGVVAAVLFNKLVYLTRFTKRDDGYCWRTAEESRKRWTDGENSCDQGIRSL